jgi:hypothetical protein
MKSQKEAEMNKRQ